MKFASILFSVALSLALCSCGGKKTDDAASVPIIQAATYKNPVGSNFKYPFEVLKAPNGWFYGLAGCEVMQSSNLTKWTRLSFAQMHDSVNALNEYLDRKKLTGLFADSTAGVADYHYGSSYYHFASTEGGKKIVVSRKAATDSSTVVSDVVLASNYYNDLSVSAVILDDTNDSWLLYCATRTSDGCKVLLLDRLVWSNDLPAVRNLRPSTTVQAAPVIH